MTAPAPTRSLDPAEVMIGTASGPGVYIATAGAQPPAPGQPFTDPWQILGYTSDDGVTIGGDKTTESITPWQSTAPIFTIITEVTRTVAFQLWQLNDLTLGLYFDTEVEAASDEGVMQFDVPSSGGGRVHAVAVEVRHADQVLRLIWRRANLDSTGDMQLQKGVPVPLDVTLSALDEGGSQVQVQMFPAAMLGGDADTLTVTAQPVTQTQAADAPAEPESVEAEPVEAEPVETPAEQVA